LDSAEKLQLKTLLRRLKTEEGGFIPRECLKEFYDIGVTPFFELVFYRLGEIGAIEFLLAYRDDEWWSGFHVMGKKLTPDLPADPFGICEALTPGEFKDHSADNGIRLKSVRVVSALHWKEHPWCHPLAVVFLAEFDGDIMETDTFRFCAIDDLPPMVPNHAEYLLQCEQVLRTNQPLVFTAEDRLGLASSSLSAGNVLLVR
jgi:hypothetical protein